MTTTEAPTTTTTPLTGTLIIWAADDGSVEVQHHFGGTAPRIEVRKAGEDAPIQVIPTTRFWRAEQLEGIQTAKRLFAGEPVLALTDSDPAPPTAAA